MVIGLKQLLDKIEKAARAKLEELEMVIDSSLIQDFSGGSATIDLDQVGGLRTFVIERLLDKYRAQGWKVGINYDQRDGDFIRFTTEDADEYGKPRK